jgi:hypothetical protein
MLVQLRTLHNYHENTLLSAVELTRRSGLFDHLIVWKTQYMNILINNITRTSDTCTEE